MSMNRLLFPSYFLLVSIILSGFASSQTLPKEEVDALRAVATALGKTNWNFSVNPCDVNITNGGWRNLNAGKGSEDSVTCNCSTVCHVTHIQLKAQNLQGSLPRELAGLPFLEEIDLSRNYLNGSISRVGNLATYLRKLPPELGNLQNIDRLIIQASGFVGPIPSAIGTLKSITDLRITDLSGPESPFPPLQNMTSIKNLILRNCNLTGELPSYLGSRLKLKTLDLSFNKLSGPIPATYGALSDVDYIYFTSNMLTGEVPNWMIDNGDNVDLTFNNFSIVPRTSECQKNAVNMFSSTNPFVENNHSNVSCLSSYACPKMDALRAVATALKKSNWNFSVDPCDVTSSDGGWRNPNAGKGFEDAVTCNCSSTVCHVTSIRITDNQFTELYQISSRTGKNFKTNSNLTGELPAYLGSITTLKLLYFTSNMLSGEVPSWMVDKGDKIDLTYNNFQRSKNCRMSKECCGKRVAKDFDIVAEANGTERAVVKSFPVSIRNRKLEIRLLWAGKGTQALPNRGSYGSLISAVSVDPDFTPPKEDGPGGGTSIGAVVGAVIASTVVLVLLIGGILWWRGCLRPKSQMEKDFKNLDFQISSFSLRQIKVATDNFDPANKIGEGGFGPVHVLREQNKLMEVVDSRLGTDYNREEAMTMINIDPLHQSSSIGQTADVHGGFAQQRKREDEESVRAMKKHYAIISGEEMTSMTDQSINTYGPFTSSSTSTANASDLYPLKPDSDYWNSRV
ncbi:hypothetical protein Bca52824_020958 [Brassica carinata]|uniref:non-specific serine/threonine protein kinase n=1 Tax=Brassica carinata TaxID=52824 RepID=A0A8X7VUA9_BRACI|nr:hypothetical protein Bca52824_020958 [Brassica carinata]